MAWIPLMTGCSTLVPDRLGGFKGWTLTTGKAPGRSDELFKAAAAGAVLRNLWPASPIIDLGALAALSLSTTLVAWWTSAAWPVAVALAPDTGPAWWWYHRGSVAVTPPAFLAGTWTLLKRDGGPGNSSEPATTPAPEPAIRGAQLASPEINLEAVTALLVAAAALFITAAEAVCDRRRRVLQVSRKTGRSRGERRGRSPGLKGLLGIKNSRVLDSTVRLGFEEPVLISEIHLADSWVA
uniref:Uncharacterized protein n=1 Tax=Sphaerodactylus townsendi TaxID=933632 RepID=A0ACB8EQR3_9SAUR